MKTAVLGGSFNPVHNGHILLADETRKFGYERILFVPASRPPHKKMDGGAGDADRLAMLELALAKFAWAQVWDGEIRRGGISYSIDTIRELKQSGMVEGRPGLIIGDDLARGFADWREVDRLMDEVDVILAGRKGGSDVIFDYPCYRLNNRIWPYSSSDVRERLSTGLNPEEMLPRSVIEYIFRKGLYGCQKT